MVRLKVAWGTSMCRELAFQFHYGTIKSKKYKMYNPTFPVFQFHYGTIKSSQPYAQVIGSLSFNSTMVRLKVPGKSKKELETCVFRSIATQGFQS